MHGQSRARVLVHGDFRARALFLSTNGGRTGHFNRKNFTPGSRWCTRPLPPITLVHEFWGDYAGARIFRGVLRWCTRF